MRRIHMNKRLTAIIQREGERFVSLCPELDVASQGDTVESARENLREALELFFECASPEEVRRRLYDEVFVTQVEVSLG
jgi:predicted RNase H-like HicB family nuclease